VGLALYDIRIFQALQQNPKAVFGFGIRGVLTRCPFEKVLQSYRYRFVVSTSYAFFPPIWESKYSKYDAIVQTDKPVPDEEVLHWLRK
jgi:hypothetical protein